MRRGYASIPVVDRKTLHDRAEEVLRIAIAERAKRGSIYVSMRDVVRIAKRMGLDEYTAWRVATIDGRILSRFCPRVRNARPRLYRITTKLLCKLFDVCSCDLESDDPIQMLFNKIVALFEVRSAER